MKRQLFFFAGVLVLFTRNSLAGDPADLSSELTKAEDEWEYALSVATYFVRNDREYVNPGFTADRGWVHLEARYNYEALKTGSLWLGYNFTFGDKLVLEATPMLGAVFGDLTGAAPGYTLSLTYKWLTFYTQGEYFIDAKAQENNFFYTWTELSAAPASWVRLGLVIDRTKAFGSTFDIRRGPLVGFTYKNFDVTTYWLDPGSNNSAVIFSVTINF